MYQRLYIEAIGNGTSCPSKSKDRYWQGRGLNPGFWIDNQNISPAVTRQPS